MGFLNRKRSTFADNLKLITSKDITGIFYKFISTSTEDTVTLGKQIAGFLEPGDVVALQGGLGSGKTYLAKGIACGLGINETLTSPTYTIICEYQIDYLCSTLFHIDAYRLKTSEDFEQIGGREIINSNGISLIEWSDRIQDSLPDNAINVTLNISGPSSRLIKIYGLEIL